MSTTEDRPTDAVFAVDMAEFSLPIEWHIPENVPSRYATNFVIQRQAHEFILSFFEIFPPIVLGPPEEIRARLATLGAVRATCVARVVVAADRMPDLIGVLQAQWERHTTEQADDDVTIIEEVPDDDASAAT